MPVCVLEPAKSTSKRARRAMRKYGAEKRHELSKETGYPTDGLSKHLLYLVKHTDTHTSNLIITQYMPMGE